MARQCAYGIQAEDVIEAAEREPGPDAHAELHDLNLAVTRGHPGPELVIQVVMVGRVPLRVLGGQPGAVVEITSAAPLRDLLGEGVLDLLPVPLGAPVEAELAPVDLRDPQPRGLKLAQPERR